MSSILQKQLRQLEETTKRSVELIRQLIGITDAQYAMLFLDEAQRNRSWFGFGNSREPYHSGAIEAVQSAGYEHLVPLLHAGRYTKVREIIRRDKIQGLQHFLYFP